MLTVEDLENEGYTTTNNITEAFYILVDGSLWDANIEYGSRNNDHREAEAFSKFNRYDGEKFWNDVTINMGLVMIIPESKEVLINPNYEPTNEQQERINEAIEIGYIVEEFK